MKTLILLIFIVSGAFSVTGMCGIINIPADFPTIQLGLNAASQHDTVLVFEGLYYENLKFSPTNLVLASHYLLDGDTSHISQTILDGSHFTNADSASVIFMDRGQDTTTAICGLTITGGKGTIIWSAWGMAPHGGGCYIQNASPVIKYNRFISDSALNGGGVYLRHGLNPEISHNEFYRNYSSSVAGAIRTDSCSDVYFHDNIIHENEAYWCAGFMAFSCSSVTLWANHFDHNTGHSAVAAAFSYVSTLMMSDNFIKDNIFLGGIANGGAGFHIVETYAIVTNNQFTRNPGNAFGALGLQDGSSGMITNNLFQENSCAVGGNAVALWSSHWVISGNQFIGNYSTYLGSALFVSSEAGASVSNNLFLNNSNDSQLGSAISTLQADSCVLRNNSIMGNTPPAVQGDSSFWYVDIDAINNWWGDPTGPYHPILNPNGLGDEVSDYVLFNPWLTENGVPALHGTTPPGEFRLYSPYPNPFNPTTVLSYELRVPSHVSLRVYDTTGRLVATLVDGPMTAGTHEVTFDGSQLSSGVYLYRLTAGQNTTAGKMVLLK